jgi:hypothetical protein
MASKTFEEVEDCGETLAHCFCPLPASASDCSLSLCSESARFGSPPEDRAGRGPDKLLEFHTQAVVQSAHELASTLSGGYQALKQYETADQTATLDFDDSKMINDVENSIARLKVATQLNSSRNQKSAGRQ